jgi:hypothetical protein
MTEDPYGQPLGSGNVVRGEVGPDDEANVTPTTTPMTRFQKVASAFRADRTDPAVTEDGTGDHWQDAGQTGSEEATAGESADGPAADAAAQDPARTQPGLAGPTAPAGADAATAGTAAAGVPEREGASESALGDFSSLLPDAAEFKARWQQVQFRFVDDPQGSVTEAADIIAQVTAKLEAAIQERQRAIAARQRALRDRWGEGSADTESLRETLLMYRALLGQLTGPKAG